jgi:hypothetical protein
MVGGLGRLSHQPQKYALPCVCLLGPSADLVPSVNDPPNFRGCPNSTIPNPVPLGLYYHQKKSIQKRVGHNCTMP